MVDGERSKVRTTSLMEQMRAHGRMRGEMRAGGGYCSRERGEGEEERGEREQAGARTLFDAGGGLHSLLIYESAELTFSSANQKRVMDVKVSREVAETHVA
jgi:hypothetical protein